MTQDAGFPRIWVIKIHEDGVLDDSVNEIRTWHPEWPLIDIRERTVDMKEKKSRILIGVVAGLASFAIMKFAIGYKIVGELVEIFASVN